MRTPPGATVVRAFSTVIPMLFPRTPGAAPVQTAPDCLGWVARLLGRFAACGWQPAQVLDCPMDQLFLLTASLQANEGADSAGEDYRERLPAAERTEIPRDSEPEERRPEHDQKSDEK